MMDDRGFIFTADATLALVVLMIFTASVVTYYMLPFFMGEDHQHLQALASDALDVMQQDGSIYTAQGKYASGNSSGAEAILKTELNSILPSNVGYRITVGSNSYEDGKGIIITRDSATAVRVMSGPNETWLGRASYENNSEFINLRYDNTATLWNFHNWLTNYGPWTDPGYLNKFPFWGSNVGGSMVIPITFSVPNDATLTGASFMVGSGSPIYKSFGANFYLNGNYHEIKTSENSSPKFSLVYNRGNYSGSISNVYNYYNDSINIKELRNGNNSFQFGNITVGKVGFTDTFSTYRSFSMPWFSIIGNYTTTIQAPAGTTNTRFNFADAGGLAVSNPDGSIKITQYNLKTGNTINSTNNSRKMDWNTFKADRNTLNSLNDGVPFVIYNLPTGNSASALSITQDVNVPSGVRILDGYINLNTYGGTDNVLVEVWSDGAWKTVFCSFDFDGKTYSDRKDGYGNLPGAVYIGDYLRNGTNKIRVTVMDNSNDLYVDTSNPDYDLVGITDSYTTITTSNLPIRWETFALSSYQASDKSSEYTFPEKTFAIGNDAKKVYMFMGVGLNSRYLKVEVKNATGDWKTLYNDYNIPFSIDLADKDISGPKVFTKGTPGNYTITPGTYRVRVTVRAPDKNWDCGDGGLIPSGSAAKPGSANPAIFSGTRVAVLYPTQTISAVAYDKDPLVAQNNARVQLAKILGLSSSDPNIHTEALFTGNALNGIPVRLDLWIK